ncbi:FecCD family ABC transporter permease [Mycetocola tolaasinivorans]|uniref:FecCD family ABC transporter permease n=1 Tax=Mycetocola tolaasinivorans TaxID=76635 RepID=UPI001600A128|nr:iron chelate uptake ABC transporter family permease subunit [Mycetocola tolaasinivorans]
MTRRTHRRALLALVILAATGLALFLYSLATGEYGLSLGQVVAALTGNSTGIESTIVLEWRLPRALTALLFGAALGLAGAIFQSLTRNPLGSPDIIGFDTGAYTGALVVMLVLQIGGSAATATGAVIGGLLTAAAVYLLAYRGGMVGFRLIVVGIGVTAMLTSVNTWLLIHADTQQAVGAGFWGAGSLDRASLAQLGLAVWPLLVLFAAATLITPGLRILELGDDAGAQLGVAVERTRLAAIVVGVGLSALVTSFAGPIAFVALSAPQIARRLAGAPGIAFLPSALTGGVLLLAADVIAQHALPSPVPVGLVTVVIGGGYFVWLLIAEGRRR